MVSKRCPYCGTILIKLEDGSLYCPNHGTILEETKTECNKEDLSYIG